MSTRLFRALQTSIRHSSTSLREPIVGWFLLLIAICFGTMFLILLESYVNEQQRRSSQDLVNQQRARRALGNIIQKDILLLGHHLHHLASATDAREVRIYQEKAHHRIKSAEDTLRVLSNGGTVTDVMPTNFGDVDEIRQTITYQHNPHENLVIEVIELVPLLDELSAMIDGLSQLTFKKLQTTDATARADVNDTLAFQLKTACSTTARASERANKIYHDTTNRVAALEQRRQDAAWRMQLARYLTIGTSAALVALVGVLILVQIIRLLGKRRRSEENLRRSRAALQTILESVPAGVIVIDQNHKVLKANTSALRLAGYQSETELVGKICHETLCPSKQGKCPILDLGKRIDHAECILVAKDGRHIPILKTVVPVAIEEETVLLEAFLDITNRKRTEQELDKYRQHLEELVNERTTELARSNQQLQKEIRNHQQTEAELKRSADALKSAADEMEQLKDVAEAANQAKSTFLANMSHEIRTPMTSVLGFADLLRTPDIGDEDRRAYAETIRRSGQSLLDLINDILDLSKIEVGKMSTDDTDCSALEILNETVSLLHPVAANKGIQLEVRPEFPLPKTIRTDPGRLRQILLNLIGNAVKFTAQGHVRIHVRVTRFADLPVRLQFAVEDTGIGMTAKQIQKIFRPFTQADSSASRRYGGTGLGLAISKKLAQVLRGDVKAQSEVGKGSTFTLSIDPGPLDHAIWLDALPETSPPSHTAPQHDKPPQLKGCILLAEDGPDNQRLLSLILKKSGLDTDIAENGNVACQKVWQAASEGTPFDLVLMDMQMPEMDGYEATRQLRQAGWKGPIVALTAHAMAGDREACLSAGCNDYLSKPIDREQLLETIARYTASNHTEATFK